MPGADDVGDRAKSEAESSRRLDGVKCNCESLPSSDDRSAVFGGERRRVPGRLPAVNRQPKLSSGSGTVHPYRGTGTGKKTPGGAGTIGGISPKLGNLLIQYP